MTMQASSAGDVDGDVVQGRWKSVSDSLPASLAFADVTGDIRIEELDLSHLSDEQVRHINTYQNAMKAESRPEDPPTPLEQTAAFLANIPAFVEAHGWIGLGAGGDMVCGAQAFSILDDENRHILQCELGVLAPFRRSGVGRDLLRRILDVADAGGKTLLVGNTTERVAAGTAFCEWLGADPGLNVHTNRLVLGDVPWDEVARWASEGPRRAPGYELVAYDGRCPDDLVDGVVTVLDAMNDAPRDDLQTGDMHWTVESYREMERMAEAQGSESWHLFARHVASNELVGLTEVEWSPSHPETVFQGNTGVLPDHRGHALGKWLKATMLERIRDERPGASEVRTGNADSNDAMLGINRALGFRPYIAASVWQITPEVARRRLSDG